jgi:hypothetical protein
MILGSAIGVLVLIAIGFAFWLYLGWKSPQKDDSQFGYETDSQLDTVAYDPDNMFVMEDDHVVFDEIQDPMEFAEDEQFFGFRTDE